MIARRLAVALFVIQAVLVLSAQDASITPTENLVADGIPAIPVSIAEKAARYTEFRAARLQSWHPTQAEMLVMTRFGETNQVHVLRQPMGARTQLTFFPDRILDAQFNPATGDYFLFHKDVGGSEWYQIYRYDVADGTITLLTDGKSRNDDIHFNHQGTRIAYSSTRRNGKDTDLWVMDPKAPKTDKVLAEFNSGGWFPVDWSHNGKWIVVVEYISANESYLWLVDAETGAKQAVIGRGGEKALFGDARFSPDDAGLYVTTDHGSEFQRLTYLDLATKKEDSLTASIQWDVEEFALARDGRHIAFATNEDGISKLYLLDVASRQFHVARGLPSGVISGLKWHANSRDVGFSLNNVRTPTDVYSFNIERSALTRWTKSETGGLNTKDFPDAQLVKWKTFDGKEISGFLYMPPARFTGKRAVIVDIHGGPEGQSRPVFPGRNAYFLNELGVAIILPNVRGSTGYGKTFLAADNGFHREDSYKDMAALFDWIKQDPRLDGDRILATGGSYGGHMTLVAATHYSDKIRCSIDVVGISNLVTFLEHTESYRRDLRRAEYGDERDQKMRAYQESVAPMNRVKSVSKPMFIVAGKNDPRVPISESDQIAAAVKANGVPRWYLTANDEGHGFAKRKNIDFQFYATVHFIQTYLLN
jgi:dipeptidyl aminopeptidase/acylaminoacyl peptidase